MSATPRYSYVGEVRGRSDFPLLCFLCNKSIDKDDPAFIYFDNGPAVFVVFGSTCSMELDVRKQTNYQDNLPSRR